MSAKMVMRCGHYGNDVIKGSGPLSVDVAGCEVCWNAGNKLAIYIDTENRKPIPDSVCFCGRSFPSDQLSKHLQDCKRFRHDKWGTQLKTTQEWSSGTIAFVLTLVAFIIFCIAYAMGNQ